VKFAAIEARWHDEQPAGEVVIALPDAAMETNRYEIKIPILGSLIGSMSGRMATTTVSFQETASGGAFAWHTAPVRQFVITLSGTLDFQTRDGEHFLIHPGDILLAEDTVGSGHSWRLTDEQPWRRA
jgi:hypothetical protein